MTEKTSKNKVNLTIAFDLCDYSETLTFEQISNTLFVVACYLNNIDNLSAFTEEGIKQVQDWLTKNDINKFLDAKEAAYIIEEAEYSKKLFAKEIAGIKYKHPSSH